MAANAREKKKLFRNEGSIQVCEINVNTAIDIVTFTQKISAKAQDTY